jgi:DNA repair protein RadC
MSKTILELPKEDRPYEKCMERGPGALTDSELLAVILKNGARGGSSLSLANEILKAMQQSSHPGLLGLLHASIADLMKIHGVGRVKAIQLKCIGELSKRIAMSAARPQLSFTDPFSIARYYMEQLRHEEQELMLSMMVDSKNHLLGERILTRGTVNATLITPREVFVEALRYQAVGLILVHNHPSGDPTPSSCDMEVTQRIYQAGELLGIELLDHIIIGDQKYISFREQKILKH